MKAARRGVADPLSVSALDLFASALGVFVVMFIILMPFYLKRPSVEAGLEGAEARLSDATDAAAEAEQGGAAAQKRLAAAERALGGVAAETGEKQAELEELDKAMKAAQAALAARPKPERQTIRTAPKGGGDLAIERLDLVIVMDTTGSMRDELEDIQASLGSIARILNKLSPDLRMGFVAYKDVDAPPVLRTFALSSMDGGNLNRILGFVRTLDARGGGDIPEPVDKALAAAIAMDWRPDASGRIIVIGDAPAHAGNQRSSYGMADGFARGQVDAGYDRRVSAITTGGDAATHGYMSQLAKSGGGDIASHRGAMIESVLLSVLK
jgi:hypothetical protein